MTLMRIKRNAGLILLLISIFAASVSCVYGECAACGTPTSQQDVLNNEWAVFMGKVNATTEVMSSTGGLVNPRYNRQNNPSLQANDLFIKQAISGSEAVPKRNDSFASVLVPLESANDSGIILDISPDPTEFIPGAISIPYGSFLNEHKQLKPVSELAQILGTAGISENDGVLIYGECPTCGGGPSAATFVYWVMLYLGHERVLLLDGGIDDWVRAMQPTVSEPASLSPKNYNPSLKPDLLATYEYVHSAVPKVIDARTADNFEAGSIPNAVNIPYTSVLDGKRIKDEASVQKVFSSISKDLPVVVYSNAGIEASMTWLALTLLGYDARIYSWQDWQANLPHLNIALQKAYARPSPAKIGDVVQITALFVEKNTSSAGVPENVSQNESETLLTIKGCATCGFGSPQGYADLSSTGGVVKIGSTSQAQKSAAEKGFTVSAQILSPSGNTVSRVILKRIKSDGDEFAGIWNANVAAGVYRVDIVATSGEITKTFPDAMQIEVASTSKYKNLGNE